ncbi:MAG: hypothetical protein DHS80DRAFT_29756 [Piptocephalis tieghemiana]|nr:MAG: hypothetical protein DHS80DRAFT_29756 [Piptocephalis tieghemiana]
MSSPASTRSIPGKKTKGQAYAGSIRKRRPVRPHTRPDDMYITTRSSLAGQVSQAKNMLCREKYDQVRIHGLGKAVERAVEVALALEQAMERRVTMVVETKSVQLMDDLIPDDEDEEMGRQSRINSAILITVKRDPSVVL